MEDLKRRIAETGKTFKIYAEILEVTAMKQFVEAMEQESVIQGALMADAHAGYTLPIGGVVAVKDMIYPSFVGYDIGCGMCALKTEFKKEEVDKNKDKIFNSIYRSIPTGFAHNKDDSEWEYKNIQRTEIVDKKMKNNGLKQLCSLGGGNHFIEISYDEDDFVWVVIHSGSRGIGWQTADDYMKIASGSKKTEGFFGFQSGTSNFNDYVVDMNFCLEFALENRKQMICRTLKEICFFIKGHKELAIGWCDNIINRNHNHAELKNGLWIHRKGATHAENGMLGIIPGNMKDGSFVVQGLGNKDSLFSSSHGAGRVFGRQEAKRQLSMDKFKEEMKDIKAKVDESVLDESSGAYKNIFDVMDLQKDLVAVLHWLRPIINIKA